MGRKRRMGPQAPQPDGREHAAVENKAEFIPSLFDHIAPHYDLMNMVMTAGVWRVWQRAFRTSADIAAGSRVVDVGCGTAELSLIMADMLGPKSEIVGIDISPKMLDVGRRKVAASPAAGRVELLEGDALALPFPENSFDAAASAWVMRNVADLDRALREMARVVRPGGRVAIMELSHPPRTFWMLPYLFYFRRVLPLLGGWAVRAGLPVAPYAWLPKSLETFPGAEALAERMRAAGFSDVRFRRITAGIVCLHTAAVPR